MIQDVADHRDAVPSRCSSCPVIFPPISWAPLRPSSPPARLLQDERFDHHQSTVVGQRARASRIGLEAVIVSRMKARFTEPQRLKQSGSPASRVRALAERIFQLARAR